MRAYRLMFNHRERVIKNLAGKVFWELDHHVYGVKNNYLNFFYRVRVVSSLFLNQFISLIV